MGGGHFSEVKVRTRKPKQKWVDLPAVHVCLHDVHAVPQSRLSRPGREDGAFQNSMVPLSHCQKPINGLRKETSVLHFSSHQLSFLRASVSLAG